MSIEESSQFASALLLCAKAGNWQVEIAGDNPEESPYVAMTAEIIAAFCKATGRFTIEPDASSGSYFLAAGEIIRTESLEYSEQFGVPVPITRKSMVSVANWPQSGWQIDQNFHPEAVLSADLDRMVRLDRLARREGEAPKESLHEFRQAERLRGIISRNRHLGDSIMTAIVIAPFATELIRFTDLGRLRLQECERVTALRTELTKCGAHVIEEGDTLTVHPSMLHGAEIETYNDHRMAMCFAILGLKVPGIKIKYPACVKKTFPNFFQKLEAPPPDGLGATIRDAATGRALSLAELFAE